MESARFWPRISYLGGMSRRGIWAAVLLVAITFAVAWFGREPSYQGRTLHAWLQNLDPQHPGPKNDAANEAVRHLGRDAVPEIVNLLESRDSSLKQKFLKWLSDHHVVKSPYTSVLENYPRAVHACYVIGPEAKPAIPALMALLNDHSYHQRHFGTIEAALGRIGPETIVPLIGSLTNSDMFVHWGVASSLANDFDPRNNIAAQCRSSAPIVVPAMLKCLQHNAPQVRSAAARALGNIGQQPATVIPALLGMLAGEKEPLARCAACLAIGQFKQQAQSATVPLFGALADADPYVRGTAAIALARIEPANSATVQKVMPFLIEDLTGIQGSNVQYPLNFQSPAIEALGECGSQARPAVPALLECLSTTPSYMQEDIAKSLKAIDPAAAAKAEVK
jgi:HEAT repeat protein